MIRHKEVSSALACHSCHSMGFVNFLHSVPSHLASSNTSARLVLPCEEPALVEERFAELGASYLQDIKIHKFHIMVKRLVTVDM